MSKSTTVVNSEESVDRFSGVYVKKNIMSEKDERLCFVIMDDSYAHNHCYYCDSDSGYDSDEEGVDWYSTWYDGWKEWYALHDAAKNMWFKERVRSKLLRRKGVRVAKLSDSEW